MREFTGSRDRAREKNLDMDIDVTIVVPTWNSEKTISDTIFSIQAGFKECPYSYEIIVVDDQSVDRTVEVVERLVHETPSISIMLIENRKRTGPGYSFSRAASIARGRYFKMVHSGNIERGSQIQKYLANIGCADLVVAYIKDSRKGFRKHLSSTYTLFMSLLSGYSLRYFQGSGVYLRDDVVAHQSKNNGNSYLTELLVSMLNRGRSYREIEIEVVRDHPQSHAISLKNLLSVVQCVKFVLLERIRRVGRAT